MKIKNISLIIILYSFIFSGCATVLKGYEDSVKLMNTPDSLQVFTKEGEEIPILKKTVTDGYAVYQIKEIKLRSNRDHVLVFKNKNEEKKISVYPKLGIGWLLLDLVCGGVPSFYDAYTGNWNKFSDINVSMQNK